MVKAWVEGRWVMVLVDMGSKQTLVRKEIIKDSP